MDLAFASQVKAVHCLTAHRVLNRVLATRRGNDAAAYFVNESGQIAGVSYTNTIPNATTGLPTQEPFLWENGKMTGLGSLGGKWELFIGSTIAGRWLEIPMRLEINSGAVSSGSAG